MATAYAALCSLLNNLEAIQNHRLHLFSFENEQIQSLRESVSFLIDFMENYDNSHGANKEAAEVLEGQIARAAHAAEDVIETHVVNQILAGSTLSGKRTSRFLMDLKNVIEHMEIMRRKVMKVKAESGFQAEQPTHSAAATSSTPRTSEKRRKVMKVKAESGFQAEQPTHSAAAISSTPRTSEKRRKVMKVKVESGFQAEQPTHSAAATSSTPRTFEKNRMVGFDEVFLRLLDLLTGDATSLQVIPITGMGGIGKTTLTKYVFENKLIVEHFDVCLWATISQQYVVQDILSKLLSVQGKPDRGTVHELGEQLHKRLYGRRYLIVLDDIWSIRIWDEIKFFFPDTSKGSRIVVTSRHSEVADHLGSLFLPLEFLGEDTSWDLFCETAFAGQGCPRELEVVGKKIVEKCKGLPLAIVVLGGHLGKSSRKQEYWENVANHMMNSILNSQENDQVFNVLSLSYSYLPIHLKPCFLYMGTIPEDDEIHMEEVIKLWIAEGFLKPNQSAISLETVAEGYLKDLIERNLILVDSLSTIVHGNIKICKIHDVLRELCLKIAKKEKFFDLVHTTRAIHREERRVVVSVNISNEHYREIFDAQRSAPLIRFLTWLAGKVLFDLKLLRVLNVMNGEIKNMGNFPPINLRYLHYCLDDINYNDLPYIPLPPMSPFWNLQTMIMTSSNKLIVAPYEIWDMLQLRHLKADRLHLPDPLYRERSHQANLHILWRVENFRLIEEVCEKIPHLKELWLTYDHKIRRKEVEAARSYYCLQNLGRFHELESLDCSFGDDPNWHGFALSFTFPSSLKSLSLSNSHLHWEELTMMVGSLPHLETLELNDDAVIGSEWTSVEGKFLRLNSLVIISCEDLIYLNADSSSFPLLKTLYLSGLPGMDELPSDIGEIPTLELIFLEECNVSLAISAMRILMEQKEQGNESLRLDVMFLDDDEEDSFKEMVEEEGLRSDNLYIRRD